MFDFVMYFSIGIQFLPFLLLIFIKNSAFLKLRRALLVLGSITIISDVLALVCAPIYQNNNPIYHVYTILTGAVILSIFLSLFKDKLTKKSIQVMLTLFMTSAIYLFFHAQGYLSNNVFSNCILSILIVLLSVLYFYKLGLEMQVENLFNNPQFLIVSSFLVFYGSTFYLLLFEDFIRSENYNLLNYTWPIHFISTIIYNLILARGVWKMKN